MGGHNINNLRYADDTVLISENEKDLQQLLNIVESKSKEKGLELNSKKTEVMVISRKEEPPLINITINGIKLKQRDHFKYLGALISSDGRDNTEISARIAQAKMTFQKMKTVLTNSHISIQTRKRTLECYIEPILMYGCEAWTISKQAQKKLEAVEMWFMRRMMKISWMAKKSNDTVLKEAHTYSTCKQNSDTTNNILLSCNEKGKVRTSHNNRNDGRKTQQRETTREDDRRICQMAGSRQGG